MHRRVLLNSQRVLFALFLGFLLFLAASPLSFINFFGVIKVTTLPIPVVLGAIILGKKSGLLLGFVFGLISIGQNTLFATPFSFLFSVFLSHHLGSVFLALVPRMALGYLAGWIFEKCSLVKLRQRAVLAGVVATLVHGCLVVIGIYGIFGARFAQVMGIRMDQLPYALAFMLISNTFVECALVGVVLLFCHRLIAIRKEQENGK